MTAPRFERRSWERNGTGLVLTHLPNRKSVALHDGGDVLAWLTDPDAHTLAATLDRMLTDLPPTYGGGTFGDDTVPPALAKAHDFMTAPADPGLDGDYGLKGAFGDDGGA